MSRVSAFWVPIALIYSFMKGSAQTPTPRPSFEVASIKLSNPDRINESYFTVRPGGVFVAHNAKLSELMQFAFKVRRDEISGAPPWFDNDRAEITAKAGPETTYENLRRMLQSLLVSEMRIQMHTEQKSVGAFVILRGKGPLKLERASGNKPADCERVGDQGPQFGGTHLICKNMKIAELADGLPDLAPSYMDRPVVDQTGLLDA